MSDELNVWREAVRRSANCAFADVDAPDELAAAVIRDYGDKRYQQAIADVVEWLGRGEENGPLSPIANEITRRFGKDA